MKLSSLHGYIDDPDFIEVLKTHPHVVEESIYEASVVFTSYFDFKERKVYLVRKPQKFPQRAAHVVSIKPFDALLQGGLKTLHKARKKWAKRCYDAQHS